ncbi:MAG: hypothetical protein U0Q03_19020 [Acidimicrobiales bacterium]
MRRLVAVLLSTAAAISAVVAVTPPLVSTATAAPTEVSVVVVDGVYAVPVLVAVVDGGVVIAPALSNGLRIDPPTGQPLVAGPAVLEAADGSTVSTPDQCLGSVEVSTVVQVLQVELTGQTVDRFAARTRSLCADGRVEHRLVAYRATVPITAVGIPEHIGASEIPVIARMGGETADQALTVTNVGTEPVHPSLLAPLTGGPPTGLSFGPGTCQPVLAAGASCDLTMHWAPDEHAVWRGPVRLTSEATQWVSPTDAPPLRAGYVFVGGPAPPVGDALQPIDPVRLLDTRTGNGAPVGAIAQDPLRLQITGRERIPALATAVLANITVTEPTASGYLTVWPTGVERPVVSNLNFVRGDTVANLSLLALGVDGGVQIFNSSGTSHVVIDVVAYLSPFAPYVFQNVVVPQRIVDTRSGVGSPTAPLGPREIRLFDVLGEVPPIARAVVLNVTAVSPTASTHLTVFGATASTPAPNASTVNLRPGEVRPNVAVISLEDARRLAIYNNSGSTDVVVDVMGWFQGPWDDSPQGRIVPLEPFRVVDTREADEVFGPFEVGAYEFASTIGGLPVRALVFNATVTEPTAPGFLTMFPDDAATVPLASNLNFVAGQTIPNQVWVRLPDPPRNLIAVGNGSNGTTHVVLDIQGVVLD